MASTTPTALTPEEKAAARRETKAAAERDRRAQIAAAKKALERAGLSADTELTKEQRERAATYENGHAGLSGKSLEVYIMTGQTGREQTEAARAEAAEEERSERTRSNITRSADPEASELAAKAKGLAEDVKSAFLPKDAREFLDVFSVTKRGQKITVKRDKVTIVEGASEEAVFERAALEGFSIGANKDKDVRGQLAGLGKGTRLWGRKLGLMILAKSA